jgi:hypothetical protein
MSDSVGVIESAYVSGNKIKAVIDFHQDGHDNIVIFDNNNSHFTKKGLQSIAKSCNGLPVYQEGM